MLKRKKIEQLVEEAKGLDRNALAELCEYFYPKIYRYVLYRVNSEEDAEDITGEVFLRMIKSLHKQRGSFQAWLFRIASNLVIDYYRRRGRQPELVAVEEGHVSSAHNSIDSQDILLQDRLKQSIPKLPPKQQQVITLKFIEGYNNSEIADILGKSVGAVKGLQFRALTALKKLLPRED
jgi:RNA polymerase sigma-70 factor (ECF subfamily)